MNYIMRLGGLWVVWLIAPFFFLVPAILIQKFVFGNDPDIWMRGGLPERDFAKLYADIFFVWITSYSTAWAFLALSDLCGGKWNPAYPRLGFIATEALRSCGGLATLAVYHWVVVELYYKGMVPSLYVPASPEAAAAEMVSIPGALWPWGLGLAVWGDVHFYVTHRMLHASTTLYNAFHKVHHRSFNTEPFSGLSMHPVEHLIYASSLVLLPFILAPFTVVPYWAFRTVMISLIIYPIPGHMGASPLEKWHWDHHTKFNWNFGSSPLMDVILGTDYDSYKEARRTSLVRPEDLVAAKAAERQATEAGHVKGA